jgi:hypothetical protein
LPSEWTFSLPHEAFGYRAGYSTEHAHGGRGSGLLWRDPGPVYGMDSGTLKQGVDATPYRGRHLRISAWLRAEAGKDGGRGHLTVAIADPMQAPWGQPWTQQNYRNAVRSADWQQRSIEVDVGATAQRLDVGAVLVGDGRLWIDDIAIEVLGPVAVPATANTTR